MYVIVSCMVVCRDLKKQNNTKQKINLVTFWLSCPGFLVVVPKAISRFTEGNKHQKAVNESLTETFALHYLIHSPALHSLFPLSIEKGLFLPGY